MTGVGSALALLAGLTLFNGPDDLAPADVEPLIYQGTNVGTCGWPTTVAVVGGNSLCTGTLIHPRVVVYAAHCGGGNKSIRFGQSSNNPGRTVSTSFCKTHPDYDGQWQGNDLALCRLSSAVTQLPITPAMFSCELDMLEADQDLAIVGFGANSNNGGAGTKRWATTKNNGFDFDQNTLQLGGFGNSGICPGDSGGPAFLQYPDGTWHTISINSTYNGSCGAPGTAAIIAGFMDWFEDESGHDLTPCHDIDGTWNPTAECQGFLSGNGANGSGTWGNWCAGTPAGGDSETCGGGFGEGGDQAPPDVEVIYPPDAEVFDEQCVVLEIEIGATDDSGIVKTAGLIIEGDDQGFVLEDAPYLVPNIQFCDGVFEIQGSAKDWSGNEGISTPNVIFVGDYGETGGTGDETTDGGEETETGTEETETGDETTETDDGGTTEDDGGTETTGDDGQQGGEGSNDSGGCSCRADASPGGALPLLVVLGLVGRRRRDTRRA
jgi:MYXO-CTERM domain-containing protein